MSILNMKGVLVGVLATITMDVLTGIFCKLRLIAPLPPRFIGRWFASIVRGQLFVNDVRQLPPVTHEMAIAVPMHYVIGITLALVYLFVSSFSNPGLPELKASCSSIPRSFCRKASR